MYNKLFKTIKNVLIIMFFFWLREKGYVNNFGFVLGSIGTIIVISVLMHQIKIKSTMKNLNKLKELTPLISKNPKIYFEKIDNLINNSSGYEKDYLILHKGNTLAKINKSDEAIKLLLSNNPIYLDTKNKGVYYNNLLGLLVQRNRIGEAKKLYDEFKDILEANLNTNFAYSIYTNIANLKYKLNQKEEALNLLDKAIKSTDNKDTINNIKILKSKMT